MMISDDVMRSDPNSDELKFLVAKALSYLDRPVSNSERLQNLGPSHRHERL